MKLEIELVSVEDRLPNPKEWVLVLEDDAENPQDYHLSKLLKYEPRYHLTPARLEFIDRYCYPEWFLTYVGGSSVRHTRNVTHWAEIPKMPGRTLPADHPCSEY